MLQEQELTETAEAEGHLHHNLNSPVSNLPGDVLLYIFSINCHLYYDNPHYPSQTTRRTAQVCQMWRRLALSSPTIWADSLDFGDPLPWLNEVILRTGNAPVKVVFPSVTAEYGQGKILGPWKVMISSVRFHFPRVMVAQALSESTFDNTKFGLALSLAERAHTLLVRTSRTQWHNLIQHFHGLSMPHLRTFAVLLDEPRVPNPVKAFRYPFNIHTPQLREVFLRRCNSDFSSPYLRNITSLSFQGAEDRELLTPSNWLRILRGMPSLEYLYLDLVPLVKLEDLPDYHASTESDSLSLPHLQYFRTCGYFITCGPIIALLQVPTTCGMHVISQIIQDNETFRMMIGNLRRRCHSAGEAQGFQEAMKALYLTIDLAHMTFSNSKPENREEKTSLTFTFSLLGAFSMDSIISNLLSVIALLSPGVNELSFERRIGCKANSNNLPETLISEIIETLPFTKMENLVIKEEEFLQRILSAVNRRAKTFGPLFPSLQIITLQGLILGPDLLDDEPFQELLRFIEQRKVVGFPIKLIELKDCSESQGVSLKSGRIEQLELFVEVVISTS